MYVFMDHWISSKNRGDKLDVAWKKKTMARDLTAFFVFFLQHDRSLCPSCQTRLLLVVVDAGLISTLLSNLSKVVSAGSATCVTHSMKVRHL